MTVVANGGEAVPVNIGSIATIAEYLGVGDPAIRLIITLFAGYPIAFIYRFLIQPQSSKPVHHIFFALSGFGLCFFNYGFDTYHSLISIWITYFLVHLLHNSTKYLLGINFVFHMAYLLTAYYFTESNDYDILWTTPHCVLTLRMIGFTFDIADGRKPKEKLSKDQLDCALDQIPSLLELTAYAYFPGSFLIGPQFPFQRYHRFIHGKYAQYKGFVKAGLSRLGIGLIYLTIRQIGSMVLPNNYFLTDAFRNQPFIWKLVYLGLWGRFSLYKYISCWLLTEGGLICLGFTYNGKAADGSDEWNGCSNVKLYLLETGTCMENYVRSFNVNTNQWVSAYIYKRLKFLNNRTISYAAALFFLAIWHGFHSGYYVAFFIEYITVTSEKQIEGVYKRYVVTNYASIVNSLPFTIMKFVVLKSYNLIYMGWSLIPFIFLTYDRWIEVWGDANYFGFIYIGAWLVFYNVLKAINMKSKSKEVRVTSNATDLSPTVCQQRTTNSKATDLSPNLEDNKKDN